VGIQGVLFDVSDRKLAESRLKDSLSFLQTLMDAVPHPVFYKDRERRFIGCNRAFGDYIGLPVEALIGRRACELFPGGQAEGYEKQDDEMLSEPGELIYEQRVRHGDGSLRHALLHKATFAGADGRVGGIVGTVTDITGLREAEKKLKYLALYDELTGLPNRRLFYDRLAQAMSRTRRGEGKMALLYVDLDEFKSINDCLGHDGGDAVLREVGRRMGACVREMDTVARLGGDEFALILQDVTTREDVEFVADRLVASLTRPIQCCTDTERAVGVSIGISLYPDDGEEPDGLLKKADLAMYRMKGEGKNGYRFFHLP
jgi:diguanylate cyclase (GGDEF)-like protein/PAS domain S-box-containing protein